VCAVRATSESRVPGCIGSLAPRCHPGFVQLVPRIQQTSGSRMSVEDLRLAAGAQDAGAYVGWSEQGEHATPPASRLQRRGTARHSPARLVEHAIRAGQLATPTTVPAGLRIDAAVMVRAEPLGQQEGMPSSANYPWWHRTSRCRSGSARDPRQRRVRPGPACCTIRARAKLRIDTHSMIQPPSSRPMVLVPPARKRQRRRAVRHAGGMLARR